MATESLDLAARRAYEQMAPFYDAFTAHHDYELWIGQLLPAARRAGLKGRKVLDVACGTGKSCLPLLRRGWEVTACDLSEEMLRVARARLDDRARLEVADMRELPELGQFPLILCLGDAVNYLVSADELAGCFAGFRRNLAAGGVVVFDLNTLTMHRTFFASREVKEIAGHRLVWDGLASPTMTPGEVIEARFEVSAGARSEPIATSVHRQRHHPIQEIVGHLEGAGLACRAIYGHGYDAKLEEPLDELRHTKAIVIAKAQKFPEERG